MPDFLYFRKNNFYLWFLQISQNKVIFSSHKQACDFTRIVNISAEHRSENRRNIADFWEKMRFSSWNKENSTDIYQRENSLKNIEISLKMKRTNGSHPKRGNSVDFSEIEKKATPENRRTLHISRFFWLSYH